MAKVSVAIIIALLPVMVSAVTLKQDSHSDGDCQCLNWKQVYSNRSGSCGMGLEYTDKVMNNVDTPSFVISYTLPEHADDFAFPESPQEFTEVAAHKRHAWNIEDDNVVCGNFYKALDSNRCARVASGDHPDKWYGRNWCYVDAKCAGAETGTIPHFTKYQVKLCKEDEPSLGDYSLTELANIGKEWGLAGSEYVLKHAYPTKDFFYRDADRHAEEMSLISSLAKPVVFNDYDATVGSHERKVTDSVNAEVARIIVDGTKIWKSQPENILNKMEIDEFTCLEGCDVDPHHLHTR